MKIAILGPSPVPFTIGGIENLLWGLSNWLNMNTDHQVEVIKLPTKENGFWNLVESYRQYYNLDLDHFDVVISVKYPTWMVRHKNHLCYMAHRLRGLYDTYHFTNMPEEVQKGNADVDDLLRYMEENENRYDLNGFFDKLNKLKFNASIPQEYFSFPGPLIRKIVHYLDNNALSTDNIKEFSCISNTVKNRREYFPPNTDVRTIYPPSNLKQFEMDEYEYVFFVSRLDAPKRIDLLINAMKYVKLDVKLYIAGTGPQEKELKKLAQKDNRIKFLGFVNDEEIERYYKNSLVIPYFPYDEDYGLITIEAMMHGKPVITTVDSGGPTEFVYNDETGFVVDLNPKEIAEKIEYLFKNKTEAKRMGMNGYDRVKNITWEDVAGKLLNKNIINDVLMNDNSARNQNRKKITVMSTFHIYPPQGGGQARSYHVYKELAKTYDVEIISLTSEKNTSIREYIAPGLVENRVAKSKKHAEEEWKIQNEVGIVITDLAIPFLIEYTPDYISALEKSIKNADIVVFSHPYLWKVAEPFLKNKIIIYEAQDVEYKIKKEMLPENECSIKLLEMTYFLEKECCEKSRLVMACSQEDKEELMKLYEVVDEKVIIVPNGVDTTATKFISASERFNNKLESGLENEKIGLFMGSWHGPNLEACEKIFEIAKDCPNTKFLLMGSQCMYFSSQKDRIPSNVGMLGLVSETQKNRIFGLVDFALNPMLSGSGTNLKMFDYMSAGIPIITTEFGTRGIDYKELFIVADVKDMASQINNFEVCSYETTIETSRKYVENKFDWSVLGIDLISHISRYI